MSSARGRGNNANLHKGGIKKKDKSFGRLNQSGSPSSFTASGITHSSSTDLIKKKTSPPKSTTASIPGSPQTPSRTKQTSFRIGAAKGDSPPNKVNMDGLKLQTRSEVTITTTTTTSPIPRPAVKDRIGRTKRVIEIDDEKVITTSGTGTFSRTAVISNRPSESPPPVSPTGLQNSAIFNTTFLNPSLPPSYTQAISQNTQSTATQTTPPASAVPSVILIQSKITENQHRETGGHVVTLTSDNTGESTPYTQNSAESENNGAADNTNESSSAEPTGYSAKIKGFFNQRPILTKALGWGAYGLTLILKTAIAGSGALSSGVNAFVNPSNSQPKQISLDWWNQLSDSLKVESAATAGFSFVINFIFAWDSNPDAYRKMKAKLFKWDQTPYEIIENIITVFMASSAAVASAAITYNAFTWTETALDYLLSLVSLILNFTTRYVGVKNLINRIRSYYDEDSNTKEQFLRSLDRINKSYLAEVDQLAKDSFIQNGNKLDDDTVKLFAESLMQEFQNNHPELFKEITKKEIYLERTKMLFEALAAVFIFAFAFGTFDQKGFDGFKQFLSLFQKSIADSMDALHDLFKTLIGAAPGLATAMLYAVSTLFLPQLIIDILKELIEERDYLGGFKFCFLMVANYYASASMENVAQGILIKTDHIDSFITPNTLVGDVFVEANRLGGGITNTNASLVGFKIPNDNKQDARRVTKYLKYKKDTDHPFKAATINAMKNFSMFANNQQQVVHDGYTRMAGDNNATGIENSERPSQSSIRSIQQAVSSSIHALTNNFKNAITSPTPALIRETTEESRFSPA